MSSKLFATVLSLVLVACAASPEQETTDLVKVRGVPDDLAGQGGGECIGPKFICGDPAKKRRCFGPNFCESKQQPGLFEYSSKTWGSPKFAPGAVTLLNGLRIPGKVVMLNDGATWSFVKHRALLIPEGESDAIFFNRGDALVIERDEDGKRVVYDRYGDAYLARLISGPWRLSYNPGAGSSKPALGFLPTVLLDEASNALAKQAFKSALNSGRSVRDSYAAAQSMGELSNAISSIEVVDKEYLLYHQASAKTLLLTKDNYREKMGMTFAQCRAADAKQAKKLAKKIKRIEEAVAYLNIHCV